MHDTVIRGGTIVDGTGKSAYTGDLALDGNTIAQVGGKAGPGKREIDADGLLVTPGWVDVHTHYAVRPPGIRCLQRHRGMESRPSCSAIAASGSLRCATRITRH